MAELKQLPIEYLQRGRYQPRQHFAEEELQELAASIQTAGLIQPIVVRPLADDCYEIIAGERRWRAAQLAQLDRVACLVNHYSDEQAAAVATIENVNRVDLNPLEEARAYKRMLDEFSYCHEEIAAVVGKSRTKITNMLRLLNLPAVVQSYLLDNKLSEGHGKILAGLDPRLQILLAEKIIQYHWSVRKTEVEAKKLAARPIGNDSVNINMQALARSLTDHVGCKVTLDFDSNKCQMLIDCHNLEIFQGVLDKLGYKNE